VLAQYVLNLAKYDMNYDIRDRHATPTCLSSLIVLALCFAVESIYFFTIPL
jgi:hypothetical protein